jgi:hypothetical protein
VSRKPHSAAFEEQAELRALRERADAAGRDVGDTVAALTGKLADGANPRAWARRRIAAARTRAAEVTRQAAGRLALPPGPVRTRLAAGAGMASGLMVIVAAAMLWQHRRRT